MWLPMRLRLRKLQKAATSPSKFLIEIKDHVSETTFFAFPVRKLGHITWVKPVCQLTTWPADLRSEGEVRYLIRHLGLRLAFYHDNVLGWCNLQTKLLKHSIDFVCLTWLWQGWFVQENCHILWLSHFVVDKNQWLITLNSLYLFWLAESVQ